MGRRTSAEDRTVDEEIDPNKDPVIEKIDEDVQAELERDEEEIKQIEERARAAERKYQSGSRWPQT